VARARGHPRARFGCRLSEKAPIPASPSSNSEDVNGASSEPEGSCTTTLRRIRLQTGRCNNSARRRPETTPMRT
jgi:hypothetical protein